MAAAVGAAMTWTADGNDVFAAKEQLQELRARWQCLNDAKIALSMFLEDCEADQGYGTTHTQPTPELSEEETLLQDQIQSLQAFIDSWEGHQAVRCMTAQQATDEANNRLSLALAECLSARESWDARVCAHDARFARAISVCDSEEWEEEGNLMEDPLVMPPRPRSPEVNNATQGSAGAAHSSGGVELRFRIGTAQVQRQSQQHAGGGSSRAQLDPQDKGKRPINQPPAAVAAHSKDQPSIECAICFEIHPASQMMAAELSGQVASSSSAQGRCGHFFCCSCMRHYVKEQVQARRYPICCPDPSCQECLGHEDIVQLLSRDTALQVYDTLVIEHSIDSSMRVYCPYKDCSCLLERPDDEAMDPAQGQDTPFECPSCHRVFCMSCGITGWHNGMTCQQFQSLPPELRSVEDAAMLRMAQQQAWKRCPAPGCGHIVERTEGCNHMLCRCGVAFCYACGSQYKSDQPTRDNPDGTPSCTCPLFAVPEDPEDVPVAYPMAHVGGAVVLRRGRPWRNGRQVSRTRCRHSDSIYDCPQGPDRCWFWHDEDDE